MVAVEGYLWKKGKSMFHAFTKRYYLLSGNCVYYYAHQSDVRPKGVIFLTGMCVDVVLLCCVYVVLCVFCCFCVSRCDAIASLFSLMNDLSMK